MGALEMLWACEYENVLGPIIFAAPLPTSPLQLLSVGNKQSLCPLMWGHKRKVRGHIKTISAGALRRHCAPHLQIASDATARQRTRLNWWRFDEGTHVSLWQWRKEWKMSVPMTLSDPYNPGFKVEYLKNGAS